MLWITADIIKTAVRHSHELWTLTVNFLVSQFGRPSPPKCSGGGFVFVKHDTVVGVLDQILGRRLLFQKHWSGRGKSSRSSLTPRDLCFSARLRRVTGRRPLWFSLRDFVPCLCPHTPSAPPPRPHLPLLATLAYCCWGRCPLSGTFRIFPMKPQRPSADELYSRKKQNKNQTVAPDIALIAAVLRKTL